MEEPSECPKCGHMSVYDYNGMPVCEDCYSEAFEVEDSRTVEEVIGVELPTEKGISAKS